MKLRFSFSVGVLFAWFLASCGVPATLPPTATPQQAAEATAGIQASKGPSAYPLSVPGPYRVGVRTIYGLEDASREGRDVGIRVWYPAKAPTGATGQNVSSKANPDRSGAPYPLILSSAKVGDILAPLLVTHGFVWAGVTRIDTYREMNPEMIDQPLDILFALDQVASNAPEGLQGMIDSEHAGAIGYSFDGYNALALSGARIDPEFYLAQCAKDDATNRVVLPAFSRSYHCAPARAWDEFAAHAPEVIRAGEDGLWRPMTDPRIRAVVPLAADGWFLFGVRGLAAVDRPTLLIVGGQDELRAENALIFEHLGAADKALIVFRNRTHMMIYDDEAVARMAHFAAAFFGHHLQGRDDLAWYVSEESVAQHPELAWGVAGGQ